MEYPGRRCCIVGAMPLDNTLLPQLKDDDLLIAADGGYDNLAALGITPHIVVGDFDSLGRIPNHPSLHVLPCEKDDTDLGYAIKLALEQGCRRIVLLGGLGGRLDHTIANLQHLHALSKLGASAILAGEGQAATVITNTSFSFPPACSGYCSVFAVGEHARGVTLEGLKYSLTGGELTNTFPLGVSNEFLGIPARVTVEEGSLLIIWQNHGPLDTFL